MPNIYDEKTLKKFEKLDPDWRDSINSLSVEELKGKITEIANDEEENQRARSENEALQEAIERKDALDYDYKEATKVNKVRLKYALYSLAGKGGI